MRAGTSSVLLTTVTLVPPTETGMQVLINTGVQQPPGTNGGQQLKVTAMVLQPEEEETFSPMQVEINMSWEGVPRWLS